MGAVAEAVDVLVSEVGPRDGLQALSRAVPTAAKHRWIAALAGAGLREIEVGSCVPPALLPNLADSDEVIREAARLPGVAVAALVPNVKGAARAVAAGAHKLTVPVSASRLHSAANLRRTPEEAVEELGAVCRLCEGIGAPGRPAVEVGISTAFGCELEGPVDEGWVLRLAARCAKAGADAVGLSDTAGHANPAQVRRLFAALRRELGNRAGGAHFHDTRGQGLANVVAALDAGVTTFDASQGGLGGCPYVPGAAGNVVTEDLVFLLEAMGLRTGIDLERLLAARAVLREALPGEPLRGHVAEAGLPKGFVPAARAGTRP
jgi:hydroxymethylglutaryl-CoA lyase